MRRAFWFAAAPLAVVACLVMPRPASAQSHTFSFGPAGPRQTPGPWRNMTFGPATFVKPAAGTAWRFVTVGHRAHSASGKLGEVFGAAMRELPPIDCAMAKPGSHTLDEAFAKPPAVTPLMHGGVTAPIAPCPKK